MFMLLMLTNSCKKDNNNNPPTTVTDIDGNVYHTVTIGTQVWMVENLKVTKLNDGTSIPYLTCSIPIWLNHKTPCYCWYNDAVINKNIYGGLYNWYAVNTGKLCPTGWHVPSVSEFTTLMDYLGGQSVAGGKLKEQGNSHWAMPTSDCRNVNSTSSNESGFTGLPGGSIRNEIWGLTIESEFWSTTLVNNPGMPEQVHTFSLDFCGQSAILMFEYQKWDGASVRCIKD